MTKKHVNEFPAVMGSFPTAGTLGEREPSRGAERPISPSGKPARGVKVFTWRKVVNKVQIQQNLMLFRKTFILVGRVSAKVHLLQDAASDRCFKNSVQEQGKEKVMLL